MHCISIVQSTPFNRTPFNWTQIVKEQNSCIVNVYTMFSFVIKQPRYPTEYESV